MSAKKLEEATDVGTIAKVDKSLSKAIMQARTAKKMTQKELATAINEKPQVVAEYESGKVSPQSIFVLIVTSELSGIGLKNVLLCTIFITHPIL